MSCNYADGLSPYHDKGQLGLQERFDNANVVSAKVDMLAKWIKKSRHVVFHTGAGISTSAGIPDFRGPKGVWTLQAKGKKPDASKDFNDTIPTPTHMAIARLVESGKVKYVISQNIDGLHLRSGLPRKYLSELHGNMFIEQCNACNRQFVRNKAVPSVGQKTLNKACPTVKPNGRTCRGRLHDSILDWEHSLPENDLAMADFNSCMADLSITIGTTMQIVPSGSLPLYTKRAGGKLVIINLQPTKHDTKADMLIHGYADEVMAKLMKQLSLRIPKYTPSNDPTRLTLTSDRYFDWTITDGTTAHMKKIYEAKCGKDAKKRLEEVIDEDDVPLDSRISTKKRKSDEGSAKKKRKDDSEGSDLEVVEEIPKRGRGRPKKGAEGETPTKLTIKKNVGSSETKYEIVKKKSRIDVEIVRNPVDDECGGLELICESDDEGPVVFTTNFKRYLYDDSTFKRETPEEKAKEAEEKAKIDIPDESSKTEGEIKDEKPEEKTDEGKKDENSAGNESIAENGEEKKEDGGEAEKTSEVKEANANEKEAEPVNGGENPDPEQEGEPATLPAAAEPEDGNESSDNRTEDATVAAETENDGNNNRAGEVPPAEEASEPMQVDEDNQDTQPTSPSGNVKSVCEEPTETEGSQCEQAEVENNEEKKEDSSTDQQENIAESGENNVESENPATAPIENAENENLSTECAKSNEACVGEVQAPLEDAG